MTRQSSPVTPMEAVTAMEDAAYLTDHEWRLREAAAGRAFYLPGRSVEVVKAEIEAMRKGRKATGKKEKKTVVNLTLSLDELLRLQKATEEVPYVVSSAANVFKMLWSLTSGGFTPPEGQLCAVYDLCARGLDAVAAKEGDTLDSFDMVLRDAIKAEGVPE